MIPLLQISASAAQGEVTLITCLHNGMLAEACRVQGTDSVSTRRTLGTHCRFPPTFGMPLSSPFSLELPPGWQKQLPIQLQLHHSG